MGESMTSLFRRGMISKPNADRIGKPKVLAQTSVQASRMADFDDKGGRKDQGGTRDAGERSVASTRHINQNQDMGSPDRASGKPSKGASVGAQRQPVHSREINDSRQQKPDFPREGSRARDSEARRTINKRSRGRIPAGGGLYGGGGRDTQ